MPTIETVSIDDVYPWEDEYGNHILERDFSTKENQRYVEDLARSMRPKGVPDQMVQLSRDGGIYRILDGNSRVRAMRLLGTSRFPAIVLEDVTPDEARRRAVEATVRTNTKKKYEATELSGYVQQLAMFADDEYVADAAGIEPEQVAKIRRARKVVGEDGDGYTIERMCAIAEFADDEEAVDRLTRCPEREISANVGMLRSKRERAEKMGGLAEALAGMGIPVVKDVDGMRAVAVVSKPESVPAELPEGTVATPHAVPGFMALYAPAEADVAEEELRAERDATRGSSRPSTSTCSPARTASPTAPFAASWRRPGSWACPSAWWSASAPSWSSTPPTSASMPTTEARPRGCAAST